MDVPPADDLVVSVVMPVYNAGRFLDEAIQSIRSQTFDAFELVIVNDGSTDDSAEIIARHAAQDRRIISVDCENSGIVHALNMGITRCRGQFIARMDGDDLSHKDRLAKQVQFLLKNPEVGVVGSQINVMSENGCQTSGYQMSLNHLEIDNTMIRTSASGFIHPTVMMRADVLRAAGGYRDQYRYAEDLDLFLRLSEMTQLRNMPDVLLTYRRHAGAVGSSRAAWQARSAVGAIEDAEHRREQQYGRSISAHAYRASWTSSDEGAFADGFRFAFLCLKRCPSSPLGAKAVARAAAKLVAGLL